MVQNFVPKSERVNYKIFVCSHLRTLGDPENAKLSTFFAESSQDTPKMFQNLWLKRFSVAKCLTVHIIIIFLF